MKSRSYIGTMCIEMLKELEDFANATNRSKSIEIFSSIWYWNTGKGKVVIETIHCSFGPRPPPATKATTRLHLSAINAQTTRKKVAGTQDASSAIKVTNRTSGATLMNFINVPNRRGRNWQKENIVGARTMQNKVTCIYIYIYVRTLRRWNEGGHRHRWVYLHNFEFPPLLTIQNSNNSKFTSMQETNPMFRI